MRVGDLSEEPYIHPDLAQWLDPQAQEWRQFGEAMAVRHPRCPNGVGRRSEHVGHHVLDPVLVEQARNMGAGGAVPCERCGCWIYVPGSDAR